MEEAHPVSEHRDEGDVYFDAMALMDRCFDALRNLRTASLTKREFLVVLSVFRDRLTRLMWEYYRAEGES